MAEWKKSWSDAFAEFDDVVKGHLRKGLSPKNDHSNKMDFMDWVNEFEPLPKSPRGEQTKFNFMKKIFRPSWAEDTSVEEFRANHLDLQNAAHLDAHFETQEKSSLASLLFREEEKLHPTLKAGLIGGAIFAGAWAFGHLINYKKTDYSNTSMFSGKDDAYNTIEGLKHGGMAQKKRREMTPFGSGWDPLRNLVAEHLGQGESTFQKFVQSYGFQDALERGSVVKSLGHGGFGEAHLMSTNIQIGDKTHAFEYVRKTHFQNDGLDVGAIYRESASANKLADLNAPNVYLTKGDMGDTYMEHFKGVDARQHMMSGGSLSKEQVSDLRSFFETAHSRGIAHMDVSRDAAIFDKKLMREGHTGQLLPHNMMITEHGRIGVYDWGLATNPASKVDSGFSKTFLGKENMTAGQIDMELVQALERQNGKVDPKYLKNKPKAAPTVATKAAGPKAIEADQNPFAPRTDIGFAKTHANSRRKLAMADTQRHAVANMFESGIFGSKRSKSTFVTARRG